jgi:hypothetical protein
MSAGLSPTRTAPDGCAPSRRGAVSTGSGSGLPRATSSVQTTGWRRGESSAGAHSSRSPKPNACATVSDRVACVCVCSESPLDWRRRWTPPSTRRDRTPLAPGCIAPRRSANRSIMGWAAPPRPTPTTC